MLCIVHTIPLGTAACLHVMVVACVVGLLYNILVSATEYVIIHGHHTCIHILCYYICYYDVYVYLIYVTHNIVHAVQLSYKITRSRKLIMSLLHMCIISLGQALTLLNIPVSSLLYQ